MRENFEADRSAEIANKIAEVQAALVKYGQEHGLRGLEGRIQRGLDPAGMLAVPETKAKLEEIAKALGAKIEDVIQLTNELHVGAIWKNADKLAEAEDPAVKTWLISAEATLSGREKEGDMTEEEFITDLDRINGLLTKAVKNPQEFSEDCKRTAVDGAKDKFIIENEVPISELDEGFLAMAINGYKSGIVKDKNGLLFVGAESLDYSKLETLGFKAITKEDRGRESTFYQDQAGNDVVKVLYPGFCIVLNGDNKIAQELAKTA